MLFFSSMIPEVLEKLRNSFDPFILLSSQRQVMVTIHSHQVQRKFMLFSSLSLQTSVGSMKKQESSRKTPISALLTMPKVLTVWITTNRGKFFKRREYQIT